MVTISEIEELFHFSTEKKETEAAQKEKNERRYVSICRKVPEIINKVYETNKGLLSAFQTVNNEYAKIISEEYLNPAITELSNFTEILISQNADLNSKAVVLKNLDLKEYKKLAKLCKLHDLKSFSRCNNIKKISYAFLIGKISEEMYLKDLQDQIFFFKDLIKTYQNINVENCYLYLIRYDLKTVKRFSL